MFTLLAMILAACTGTNVVSPGGVLPFPHASDIQTGPAHGPLALEFGAGACNTCHDQAGSAARPCSSCHDNYPHPDGWLAGAVHGAGLTGAAGPSAVEPCMSCHGDPLLIAGTERSCTSCHASYPHVEGWKEAGKHGIFASLRGSAAATCGSCHGASLEGAGEAPACNSCHVGYPHPAGWAAPEQHAVAWALPESTCATCHGEGGTGGTANVACSQCHVAMPHAADWASTHIPAAGLSGELVCVACHDAGSGTPAAMPASCADRCHGGEL